MANQISVIFEVDKDGSGRTTLRQIDSQIDGLGKTSKGVGSQIEGSLSFFKTLIILEFFRQGIVAAFEFGKAAVAAFNEAQAAALGLQTVAKGAGVDPQAALAAVQNLDLVKNGLLTVAEASTALKNNLRTGFSLEQSIELIKGFGDAAAFNKQSAISFGDAVVRTSEGIRQNLSTLSDAGGITTNLSVIQGKAGITFDSLTDKVNDQADATSYYNELLKETAVFSGDAEKKANTFAGQQDALAAKQKVLLQTVGEIIASSPELQRGFQAVGDTLAYLTSQLKDSDSELHKFASNAAAQFGALIEITAKLARGLNAVAAVFNFLNPIGDALNPQFTTDDEAKFQADAKTKFDKNRTDFLAAQKKLNEELAQAPIISAEALTKKAEKDKKAFAEMKRDSDAYFRAQEADEKLIADLREKSAAALREVGNATRELQAKLSINPIALTFDAAILKQQEFLEKFKRVPREMTDAFVKASNDVAKLDFFKGVLAQGQGLSKLISDRAELQAGRGGADLKDKAINESLAFEERKLELILLGANVRGATSQKELEHQALLFELERKRAAGTLSNAEQAILLRKIELSDKKFTDEKKFDALKSTAIDQQLKTVEDFLKQAESAAQKQFANEQILSLTSDVGKLTPSQIESRQAALNESIVTSQAAFRENFERLKDQTAAQKDNTLALVAVGNRLSAVEGALGNFKEGAIIKIVDETAGSVGIDLGSV